MMSRDTRNKPGNETNRNKTVATHFVFVFVSKEEIVCINVKSFQSSWIHFIEKFHVSF